MQEKTMRTGARGILFFAFLFSTIFGFSLPVKANVEYDWVKTWGATYSEDIYLLVTKVVSDADGNVYIAGNFRGTFDFDTGGGTDVHASEDNFNAYITKYDASGNYEWTRSFGGDGTDQVRAIATDSSGNVYIAGDFWYTVDFDTDPVLVDERTAAWDDAFLVKYDASGDYKWVRTWGGGGSNVAYSVDTDSGGYVYVTGDFYGTTDFDPHPIIEDNHTAGWNDAFLAKYDALGDFQWAKTWGGTDSNKAPTSTVDTSGHVYVSGYFYGTTDFDPDPVGEDSRSDVGGLGCLSLQV